MELYLLGLTWLMKMKNLVAAPDASLYCPPNYEFYNGRCFIVHVTELNFTDAENECNKLPGGHLAAYRSQEELDFIIRITEGFRPILIGLNDIVSHLNWVFTDGSTLPEGMNVVGSSLDCVKIRPNTEVADSQCFSTFKYICMMPANNTIELMNPSPTQDYENLVDFNNETCVNSSSALLNQYRVDFTIHEMIQNGVVSVFFSKEVLCRERKVLYTVKENPSCDNNRDVLMRCQLLTGVSDSSTSCDYRCRCKQDGCHVVLADFAHNYHAQPADICEITYWPDI